MSNAARAGGRDRAVWLSGVRGSDGGRRALVTLELVTGAAALAGGVLLAAAPDGSLLRADPAVLGGTPFSDWRVPGVLLAGLVGGAPAQATARSGPTRRAALPCGCAGR
jgi:hypothetical protein